MSLRVVLEVAPKKSFASALDWPGWSRSGKTPDDAVRALVDHAPRYANVARRAGLRFAAPSSEADVEVVERVHGGGGTEFGVPGAAASVESEPPAGEELDRLVALLRAAWATFDAAANDAKGVQLAKGPRGGGRDLDKIIEHVRDAETGYLGQLGSRAPASSEEDPRRPMTVLRKAFIATLRAGAAGEPVPNPRRTQKPWSPRYAVRRSAWHALDHAWEIEDRATTR